MNPKIEEAREMGRMLDEFIFSNMRPKDRVFGLTPKEALSAFKPEEVLSTFKPQQIESYLKSIKK